jgi:hypothetical protein
MFRTIKKATQYHRILYVLKNCAILFYDVGCRVGLRVDTGRVTKGVTFGGCAPQTEFSRTD